MKIKLILYNLLIIIILVYSIHTLTRDDKKDNNNTGYENRSHLINKSLATPENPVKSPSGKYLLIIENGYDGVIHYNQFKIINIDSQNNIISVEYKSDYKYRTRDTLYFLWDLYDRVWIYSGDIGTTYWEKSNNNLWLKHIYRVTDIPAPDLLKELRPKYHTQ